MAKRTQSKKKIGGKSKKPKQMVNRGTEPLKSDSPLTFSFTKNNWMKSVSVKSFTNKLKDEEMFSEYILDVFYTLIPTLQENGDSIIKQPGAGRWYHCHPLNNDALDKAIEVAKLIHGEGILNVKDGSKIWQFGFTGGIRLIAIHNYIDNFLTPLFIDYHHQLYPSEKHNQKNIEQFSFCPIDKFIH